MYNSLYTLVKDTSVLRDYTHAILTIFQVQSVSISTSLLDQLNVLQDLDVPVILVLCSSSVLPTHILAP